MEDTREAIRQLENTKEFPVLLADDSLAMELILRVKCATLDRPRVKTNDPHYFRSLFNLTAHQETRKRLTNLNVVDVLVQSLRLHANPVLVATLSNLAYEERTKHEIMRQHDGASLFVGFLMLLHFFCEAK